jgi:hypothetical protein
MGEKEKIEANPNKAKKTHTKKQDKSKLLCKSKGEENLTVVQPPQACRRLMMRMLKICYSSCQKMLLQCS